VTRDNWVEPEILALRGDKATIRRREGNFYPVVTTHGATPGGGLLFPRLGKLTLQAFHRFFTISRRQFGWYHDVQPTGRAIP
jgi:hypothetical protein